MRAVIQRVSQASVAVEGQIVGQVGRGLLVLLGVGPHDDANTVAALARKVAQLRIFPDDAGRFDRSVQDIAGGVLVVSQFTLYADTRRGRRPSFVGAAAPDAAAPLVDAFVLALRDHGLHVATGVFGAHMEVALVNDGPVTITLDTEAA